MEYRDRLTRRVRNDSFTLYFCDEDSSRVFAQLGFYEDMGLSPLELADTLIQGELFKPKSDWDMDKIEKWQSVKENYLKYLGSINTP